MHLKSFDPQTLISIVIDYSICLMNCLLITKQIINFQIPSK